MNMIHKYPANLGVVFIEMPAGAQILTMEYQHGELNIWALVDDVNPYVTRHFLVVGTGHPLPYSGIEYITTVFQNGGQFVWHLFEVKE